MGALQKKRSSLTLRLAEGLEPVFCWKKKETRTIFLARPLFGLASPFRGMACCIVTTVATVADVEYVLIEDGSYFESNLVELLT